MRIIGGHDYYDSVLSQGRDDAIVFVRHKDKSIGSFEIPGIIGILNENCPIDFLGKRNFDVRSYIHNGCWTFRSDKGKLVSVSSIAVIYAGKVCTGARVNVIEDGLTFNCWDSDSLGDISKDLGFSGFKPATRYDLSAKKRLPLVPFHRGDLPAETVDFLINNHMTVVTYDSNNRCEDRKNGIRCRVDGDDMGKFDFARVVDPYTMFQEISMWVGGILAGSGRPMVEISDEDKIGKHGFDSWSFRKMPEGKC